MITWLPHVERRKALTAACMVPDLVVYVVLPSAMVKRETRLLAEDVAELAAEELMLPAPPIGWFVPWADVCLEPYGLDIDVARDPSWSAFTFFGPELITGAIEPGKSIWLRPDLSERELALTIAHELRHDWQRKLGRLLGYVTGQGEQDAREYESTFLRYLRALRVPYAL